MCVRTRVCTHHPATSHVQGMSDLATPSCTARRHPASGYVQGMNDLVTPFYTVFLGEHLGDAAMEQWQPDKLAMVRACVRALLSPSLPPSQALNPTHTPLV